MLRHWRWLFVLALAAFLLGNRTFRMVIKQQRALNRTRAQVNRMKQEEKSYREQMDRMARDPAYMEEMARIRAGMIRPGETPYRFLKPVSQPKK